MLPLSFLKAVTALFAVGATALPQSTSSGSSVACNNSPDLCDRAYNNITFMGAHDSSFLRDDSTGNSPAGNQFLNATKALNAGLRLLQAQVHQENGTLYLCHTSCGLLNAGTLVDWLTRIRVWMDGNPNEVVTMVLVNSDNVPAATFGAIYEEAGLDSYGYVPTSTEATGSWPTLSTMIDAGTRMVNFIASITADANYPYLLSQFTYVFETEFEVLNLGNFNCALDRPSSLVSEGAASAVASNYLGMVNHFAYQTLFGDVIVPDVTDIDTTNSADTGTLGALGMHVTQCQTEWGIRPQFVLVDFWDQPTQQEVMSVADSINGISGAVGRATNQESDVSGDGERNSAKGTFDNGLGVALSLFVGAAVLMF